MAQYRMKAPDGQFYQVEGPEGATDEQVRQEIIRQNPQLGGKTSGTAPSAPTAPASPPAPPSPLMSSPKGFFGPGVLANLQSRISGGTQTPEQAYAERVPQLEGAVSALAPLALPVAGPLARLGGSLAGRLGQQAVIGAGTGALTGAKEGLAGAASGALSGGATGAVGGAIGEGVGKGVGAVVGPLASRHAFKKATDTVAKNLDDYLSREIPAWRNLGGTGPRALWEKAHGSGERALDTMFKAAKKDIPEALETQIPRELAFKAGFQVPEDISEGAAKHGVQVSVRALVDRLNMLKGSQRHEAWNAINYALEGTPISPALQSARKQYALGMGWIEFANKGKFLKDTAEGGFDLLKAQKALSEHGRQRLLKRSMDEPFREIQGQGAVTQQDRNLALPFKVGPFPMNVPLGTMYKGVPMGPLGSRIQSGGGRLGGALGGLGAAAAQEPQD